MSILVISSSLDPNSRSRDLAKNCLDELATQGADAQLVDLAELNMPNFDNDTIYQTKQYQELHKLTREAEGIVLCSPIYNWGCCSELKKYIEYIGSTPPDGSITGALYDKVITFVYSSGLPHAYMSHTAMASALMLDFKCIINPYHVHIHNRDWVDGQVSLKRKPRLEKSMHVMVELCQLLSHRTYRSGWDI